MREPRECAIPIPAGLGLYAPMATLEAAEILITGPTGYVPPGPIPTETILPTGPTEPIPGPPNLLRLGPTEVKDHQTTGQPEYKTTPLTEAAER